MRATTRVRVDGAASAPTFAGPAASRAGLMRALSTLMTLECGEQFRQVLPRGCVGLRVVFEWQVVGEACRGGARIRERVFCARILGHLVIRARSIHLLL